MQNCQGQSHLRVDLCDRRALRPPLAPAFPFSTWRRKFLDGLAKLAALSSSIIEREWCAALSGESFQKMCGFEFMPSSLVSAIAATTPYGFHKPLLPAGGG